MERWSWILWFVDSETCEVSTDMSGTWCSSAKREILIISLQIRVSVSLTVSLHTQDYKYRLYYSPYRQC